MKENKKQREKRRKSKQDKGITLVALVVTIIILLILAGVTLSGALSENGLFQRAKKAVNEYKKAEEVESNAIEEIGKEIDKITFTYNDYVGCYVDGYKPKTTESCTILGTSSGYNQLTEEEKTKAKNANSPINDSGDQTFETETEMKWRIWDYNKSTNTIRLISSRPTSQTLTLKGANGYNNGVWAINEICETCYGNEDVGATATSLKRTDVQKVSTYNYTKYKHDDGSSEGEDGSLEVTEERDNLIHFGETMNFEEKYNYPRMWQDHDKNWSYKYENGNITGTDDETIWEQEYDGQGNLTGTYNTEKIFKQSYYKHYYKNNEFIKNEYYNLLFKDDVDAFFTSTYWLSTRSVHVGVDSPSFDIQSLISTDENNCRMTGAALYWGKNNGSADYAKLRPIVSINLNDSDYELVKEEQEDDNGDIKFLLQEKKAE